MPDSQSVNEARAVALELAARLVVRELDPAAVESLKVPALRDALCAYDDQCGDYIDALDSSSGLEAAATDFCGLFLMSKRTSPHASAHLGSNPAETGAAISQAVAGWMSALGVEVAPGVWGNIARDHLAVLCGLVSLSLLSDNESLAKTIARETLSWVPAFADAVERDSQNPLYRAAVRLAEHALGDLLLVTPAGRRRAVPAS